MSQDQLTGCQGTKLTKLSNIYEWIGKITIAIGLFLLIGSILASMNNERVTIEPVVGGVCLFGGLSLLFAAYVGKAVDEIRNNSYK